jgi:glycosyltransferase involved in cell wall biosynthesis
MTFSLVIPVYRNEASLDQLVACLETLNRGMDGELEAVFVIDGSPDGSHEILARKLPGAGFRSQLLSLSRNFGSFAAILAGLEHGSGSQFAVMAADLQEPPELILEFRRRLLEGSVDIVVGRRTARADPMLARAASAIFWRFYQLLVQPEIPKGGVDVFACTKVVRDQLLLLRERNSTLVGLLFWVGFRRTDVAYVRRPRRHGASSWSLSRRVRYLLDSVFAFSDLPVRLLSLAGIGGMTIAVVLGAVVLITKLTGGIDVPGYTATILTVVFFGGLNAFGLGLIGEYLWRTFENTKSRPAFIVAHRGQYPGNPRDRDPSAPGIEEGPGR